MRRGPPLVLSLLRGSRRCCRDGGGCVQSRGGEEWQWYVLGVDQQLDFGATKDDALGTLLAQAIDDGLVSQAGRGEDRTEDQFVVDHRVHYRPVV